MEQFLIYRCNVCGNLMHVLDASDVIPICCGQKMEVLAPNTTDASTEHHVPVVTTDGCKVCVRIGITPHPMTQDHHICWICIRTNEGYHMRCLCPEHNDTAEACFTLQPDEVICAVYSYCNLHSLWEYRKAGD